MSTKHSEEITQSIDGDVSAKPKDLGEVGSTIANDDLSATPMDFGEMNLEDSVEAGYTDPEGNAISMAKEPVKDSPTGAYTDIGAGRSSVIKHH